MSEYLGLYIMLGGVVLVVQAASRDGVSLHDVEPLTTLLCVPATRATASSRRPPGHHAQRFRIAAARGQQCQGDPQSHDSR